ncbi:MAG: hypothetical protein K8U57_14310 [Planctomycetes bacterium]|nr:hypothetical protein [Planctomycetota bacterium]
MTTETRTRAAAVLDLPADANADAAASAFLAALPTADFLPTSARVAAVNVLVGSTLPFETDEGAKIGPQEMVDDFIGRFWSLDPTARVAEWVALSQCEEGNSVRSRLMALQSGLAISSDPQPEPVVEEVAGKVRELFLLSPRVRAIRRNEWLIANVIRLPELVEAATRLRRLCPTLVELEPQLFARLDRAFDAVGFATAATAPPLHLPDAPQRVEMAKAEFQKRYEEYQHDVVVAQARQAASSSSGKGSGSGGVGWLAIFGVIFVIRIIASLGSNQSQSNKPAIPNNYQIQTPVWKSPDPHRFGNDDVPRMVYFSTYQIAAFIEKERNQVILLPHGYDDWVLAGSPRQAGTYPVLIRQKLVPKPRDPAFFSPPDTKP